MGAWQLLLTPLAGQTAEPSVAKVAPKAALAADTAPEGERPGFPS